MVDTPTSTGPANYDGDQVISMDPTSVYETTFYRESTDVTFYFGGNGMIFFTTSNPFPDSVHVYGTTADGFSYGVVPAMLNTVSASFQNIYDIWQSLSLSWIGSSADAAQELQNQLDKIQNRLFGTKVDNQDQPGVLEQMSSAAANAASIYSNVEETNTKMFNDFADAINWTPLPDEDPDPDPKTPMPPAPATTTHTFGPITETY